MWPYGVSFVSRFKSTRIFVPLFQTKIGWRQRAVFMYSWSSLTYGLLLQIYFGIFAINVTPNGWVYGVAYSWGNERETVLYIFQSCNTKYVMRLRKERTFWNGSRPWYSRNTVLFLTTESRWACRHSCSSSFLLRFLICDCRKTKSRFTSCRRSITSFCELLSW